MRERRIIVRTPGGLHARPVAEIARIARTHSGSVRVRRERDAAQPESSGGRGWVDAASVLAVMMLDVSAGEVVLAAASDPGADDVLDALERALSV